MGMQLDKVTLAEKFNKIDDYWDPKLVGELNGQVIKIAKIKGEFIWHKHDEADEFFLVVEGEMGIMLGDREIILKEGEFFVVPRGVEHKPIAREEAHILMFEPQGTLNTGNVQDERTRDRIEKI